MDQDRELTRSLMGPWVRRGTLFVPPTVPQRHGEMENIKAYVKYSDLFTSEPTLQQFIEKLRDVGLRSVMLSLSRLMTVLHHDGVSNSQLQAILRDSAFTAHMFARLREVRNWHERIIFFPQQVLFTMKMALMHSPDRNDGRGNDEFRDVLAELLLIASEFLDKLDLPEDPEELERVMVAHQVRNYLMNMTDQVRYMIPRASLLYLKLPYEEELRRDTDFIDISAVFTEATGFALKEYVGLGLAVLMWFVRQSYLRGTYSEEHSSINPNTFFREATLDQGMARRFLESMLHTYASALEAFRARAPDELRLAYDFLPFMTKPLYQVREDIIIPVNISYLEAKFTSGIYWTIFDFLQGDDRIRFSRFFGRIFERYVQRTLQRMVPHESALAQRVFPEFVYQCPAGERKTSDVVIVYPRSAIFLEATASRIRMEATAISGDIRAFEQDVEKIILSSAHQLTERIRDFRDNLYCFGEVESRHIDRIYPVIVTVHSLPESTIIWRYIRRMLEGREVVEDLGIEPVQLIDVEELEILETILEQGVTLLDVLQAKAGDPERRNIGLKNFLIARFQPRRNEFLRREYEEIGAYSKGLLFGNPG